MWQLKALGFRVVAVSSARTHVLAPSPSASRSMGRSATGSCTLRDTFLGGPVPVYPGRSEILAHRAQVRRSRPRARIHTKPSATETPARTHVLAPSPSASRHMGRPATGSCTLRDTFLGGPVPVYPGRSEILAHRAQVRRFHPRARGQPKLL